MKLVPGCEYRLNLSLDLRVAFEAVLIQRLKQQPNARQQEWLRRLLVLGFCEECKSLQNPAGTPTSPAMGAVPGPQQTQELNEGSSSLERPVQPLKITGLPCQKPLAALQKVLGAQVA